MTEFQGYHTNQACYKSVVTSPEYSELLLFHVVDNIRQVTIWLFVGP